MAKLTDIADGQVRFDDGETLTLPPCVWAHADGTAANLRGWRVGVGERKPPDFRCWGLLFRHGFDREAVESGLRYLALQWAKHRLRELAEETGLSFVVLAAVAKGLKSREVRDGQATFPGRGGLLSRERRPDQPRP